MDVRAADGERQGGGWRAAEGKARTVGVRASGSDQIRSTDSSNDSRTDTSAFIRTEGREIADAAGRHCGRIRRIGGLDGPDGAAQVEGQRRGRRVQEMRADS